MHSSKVGRGNCDRICGRNCDDMGGVYGVLLWEWMMLNL